MRIEAAVVAGSRHASGPQEAWISAAPFNGGLSVLVTGQHGFDRTVTFAIDDDPAVIGARAGEAGSRKSWGRIIRRPSPAASVAILPIKPLDGSQGARVNPIDWSINTARDLGLTKRDMFQPARQGRKPVQIRKLRACRAAVTAPS